MASNVNTVEKIVAILEANGVTWPGGGSNARIERTHAGRHQRSAGAWSWFLVPVTRDGAIYPQVGSQWPAKTVALGAEVSRSPWGSYDLDPPASGSVH